MMADMRFAISRITDEHQRSQDAAQHDAQTLRTKKCLVRTFVKTTGPTEHEIAGDQYP